jgi:hypothetical protein
MKAKGFVLGCALGIALFSGGAVGFAWASTGAAPEPMASGCGGICGKSSQCSDSRCPRCTMDRNYNWSCTG